MQKIFSVLPVSGVHHVEWTALVEDGGLNEGELR